MKVMIMIYVFVLLMFYDKFLLRDFIKNVFLVSKILRIDVKLNMFVRIIK